jgi:hypothetical protein
MALPARPPATEWIKAEMDLRKYKSTELYGRPSDPALQKEIKEYIRTHQPPKQQ